MSIKNIILIFSIILLVASILFSFNTKKNYFKTKEEILRESKDIKETIALKKLWDAKGLKSKIEKVINKIPNKKVHFKRKSFEFSATNLNYRDLNHILNKFASMPLEFKKLNIKKVGSNFNLECLCEW